MLCYWKSSLHPGPAGAHAICGLCTAVHRVAAVVLHDRGVAARAEPGVQAVEPVDVLVVCLLGWVGQQVAIGIDAKAV